MTQSNTHSQSFRTSPIGAVAPAGMLLLGLALTLVLVLVLITVLTGAEYGFA